MAQPNLAALVMDAFERSTTLSSYGMDPLTVGWWRGEAFVKVWNYRTGAEEWRPFATSRPEPPKPRAWDPFASNALFYSLRR